MRLEVCFCISRRRVVPIETLLVDVGFAIGSTHFRFFGVLTGVGIVVAHWVRFLLLRQVLSSVLGRGPRRRCPARVSSPIEEASFEEYDGMVRRLCNACLRCPKSSCGKLNSRNKIEKSRDWWSRGDSFT